MLNVCAYNLVGCQKSRSNIPFGVYVFKKCKVHCIWHLKYMETKEN